MIKLPIWEFLSCLKIIIYDKINIVDNNKNNITNLIIISI